MSSQFCGHVKTVYCVQCRFETCTDCLSESHLTILTHFFLRVSTWHDLQTSFRERQDQQQKAMEDVRPPPPPVEVRRSEVQMSTEVLSVQKGLLVPAQVKKKGLRSIVSRVIRLR